VFFMQPVAKADQLVLRFPNRGESTLLIDARRTADEAWHLQAAPASPHFSLKAECSVARGGGYTNAADGDT
jgi:hypothetical protein